MNRKVDKDFVFEKVEEILDGIDKDSTCCSEGWWETSKGVELGTERLRELRNFINEYFFKEGMSEEMDSNEKFNEEFFLGCTLPNNTKVFMKKGTSNIKVTTDGLDLIIENE